MNKKVLITLLKVLVSVAVIYIIIQNVDWLVIRNNISQAYIPLITIAFILNLIERAELTLKWNLLIRVKKIYVSFIKLFNINLIGGFLGLLLPSSLGTDIIRGYYLTKYNSDKLSIVSTVFLDRILGVLSLLLLSGISLLLTDIINSPVHKFLIFLGILSPFLFLYVLQKKNVNKLINNYVSKIKSNRISNFLVNLNNSLMDYKEDFSSVLKSFLISILVQFTRVLTYYIIALSFNINYPIIYFLMFTPIIMLVIMLPISVGGLGVKEGTFIAFFSMVGMSVESAVLISLTNTIINTIVTLLGGIVYIFYKPEIEQKGYNIK